MLKKRAMATDKLASSINDLWLDTRKSMETGYADNQPKYPFWVQPYNYDSKEWDEMNDWVVDTMGYSDWLQEDARWVGSDRKYWFRDERDRTMFILKWS